MNKAKTAREFSATDDALTAQVAAQTPSPELPYLPQMP